MKHPLLTTITAVVLVRCASAKSLNLSNISIGIDKQKGVAVAVNGTIVPNSIWSETELHANDQVLVVQATQGG